MEDRGHILFVLSVILWFCHSVLFSETLTLLITFEQWVLELWYFIWIFPVIKPSVGTIIFNPVTLTFEFDPFLKTLTLIITFKQWVLKLWYFTWIFPCDNPFRGYHYFLPCDLDLGVWPIFEIFNLANKFWTVSARDFILHMSISCDKIF